VIHAGDRSNRAFGYQNHRLGNAVQSQIAGDGKLISAFGHAGTRKACGRELSYVKEAVGLEVVVARFLASVDSGNVDGRSYRGLGDIALVKGNDSRYMAETPVNLRDGEMADAEVDFAMCGSDFQVEV
jgi:hypothetical protein